MVKFFTRHWLTVKLSKFKVNFCVVHVCAGFFKDFIKYSTSKTAKTTTTTTTMTTTTKQARVL